MSTKRGYGLYFADGVRDGIPIGLGYFSVSFGMGILATTKGFTALAALIMSATNLTSAGQAAGIEVIGEALLKSGGVIAFSLLTAGELALAQVIINLRYSLMAVSLSQKLSPRFGWGHRLMASAFITDEIYAVGVTRKGDIEPRYWYGLAFVPYFSWALGTLCGALAGNILPGAVGSALGIALYGMFLAIIVPPARESGAVCFAACVAAVLSCLMFYLPFFSFLSAGFRVIICALAAACAAALRSPVEAEK